MAKPNVSNRNSRLQSDDDDDAPESGPKGPTPVEVKPISDGERKALFKRLSDSNKQILSAQEALTKGEAARELVLKEIFQRSGTGPYVFEGQTFQVLGRSVKDENGEPTGTTYFIKRLGNTVTRID